MEVTLLAIAKRAREILTPESAWTKNSYAKNADGHTATVLSWDGMAQQAVLNPTAVSFCSIGAVRRATAELAGLNAEYNFAVPFQKAALTCVPEDYRVTDTARETLPSYADVISFNDSRSRTHAEVLGMFDCVIAKLEAGEPTDAQ